MQIRNMMITAGLVAGLAFPGASVAGRAEITLRAQVETLDPNGYVECKITATSAKSYPNASLQLPDDNGTDTTRWGSSGSWSPEVWNDGLYHVEAIGGSWNELVEGSARSCTATVSGARRKDIEMTLESIASNGLVIDAAEGR